MQEIKTMTYGISPLAGRAPAKKYFPIPSSFCPEPYFCSHEVVRILQMRLCPTCPRSGAGLPRSHTGCRLPARGCQCPWPRVPAGRNTASAGSARTQRRDSGTVTCPTAPTRFPAALVQGFPRTGLPRRGKGDECPSLAGEM